jgi:hypothetical protein
MGEKREEVALSFSLLLFLLLNEKNEREENKQVEEDDMQYHLGQSSEEEDIERSVKEPS